VSGDEGGLLYIPSLQTNCRTAALSFPQSRLIANSAIEERGRSSRVKVANNGNLARTGSRRYHALRFHGGESNLRWCARRSRRLMNVTLTAGPSWSPVNPRPSSSGHCLTCNSRCAEHMSFVQTQTRRDATAQPAALEMNRFDKVGTSCKQSELC
jgi:hypothetical protein